MVASPNNKKHLPAKKKIPATHPTIPRHFDELHHPGRWDRRKNFTVRKILDLDDPFSIIIHGGYPPGNDHISPEKSILSRWFSELPQVGYVNFLEGIVLTINFGVVIAISRIRIVVVLSSLWIIVTTSIIIDDHISDYNPYHPLS